MTKQRIANIERAKKDLQDILDAISSAVFTHDEEFRIIRANKAYAEIVGMSFKDMLGKPYYEIFPRREEPFKKCMILELQQHEEEVFLPETNKVYRMRYYPVLDEQKKYQFSIHILEDITEAKQTKEKIRRNYDTQTAINLLLRLSLEDTPLDELLRCTLDLILSIPWLAFESRGNIFLVEDDPRVLVMKAQNGICEPIQKECSRVPFGRCLCGQAALTRQIQFADCLDDRHHTSYVGIIPHGHYCVPVLYAGKTLGVINMYLREGHRRDQREEEFLTAIANALAGVIQRKEAEERIKQEADLNRALLSVAESLSTTFDREEIFKRVMDILPSVLEADRFVIFLWDNEVKAFIPTYARGMPVEVKPFFRRVKMTTGIPIIERLQRGEIVVMENVNESPLFSMDIAGTFKMRSIMGVPIISRGKTIGVMSVERIKVKKPFTDRDKTFLKNIVYLLTTVLENSSLYRDALEKAIDLSQRIQTISVMHEIDRVILSTLDSQGILENAVMMIGRVISCEKAIIALLDKEKGGFIFKAGWGLSLLKGTFVPFSDTTATEVIRRKRPEFIANLSEIKKISPFEETSLKEGLLSHIRVPIIVKDEAIGVLSIGAKRSSAFNTNDLSTLEKISTQIGVALENARLVSDAKELFLGSIKSLSEAIDAKSPWTKGHSERVTEYAIQIGKEVGLQDEELDDLRIAGLLHDIGKIGIHDTILDKPEKLNRDEYEIVKRHPLRGVELISPIKELGHIIPWIRHHHESFDGKGYPDNLKGEEIPLQARILAVADTFDSMTAERPYRETPGREKTIKELKSNAGTQFDPKVVEAFLRILKIKNEKID